MRAMFDLVALIEAAGIIGITAIIFAETGLFFGFIFPGDTLLFTAGFLAAQGAFNIWLLVICTTVAAIIGDSVGYWSGKKAGPYIFKRPDSFWFSTERVEQAQKFFEKYGALSIIIARFLPIVRTFVPIVAGVAGMNYARFFRFNVIGAFLWAFLVPLLGYWLGEAVPDIDRYLIPLVLVGALFPILPVLYDLFRRGRKRRIQRAAEKPTGKP